MSIEQTYPDGITSADHIAHDVRHGRFPQQSSMEVFLSERMNDKSVPPDFWDLIRDDPALAAARRKLSIYEFRLIMRHALASKPSVGAS